MKINKFWTLTLLSLISSSHLLSANWVNKDIATSHQLDLFNQLVIDDQGNSTAYWQAPDRLYGATLESGATKWQLTNDFSGHPKGGFPFVGNSGIIVLPTALAISKEGIVASLWADFPKPTPSKAIIRASLLPQGSQVWETPKVISTTVKTDQSAVQAGALTFDSQSRLHAAWCGIGGKPNPIQTAYLDLGASKWSKPVTISTGITAGNSNPLFANDPLQDRIVAVWKASFADGKEQLYGSYLLANSKTWSVPKVLSKLGKQENIINYSMAQVNITTNKNYAVVGWLEFLSEGDATAVVRYAVLDSSNKWSVNHLLDSSATISAVSLAIDPELITTFVYDKGPSSELLKVYSKTLSAIGELDSAQTLSGNDSQVPKVIVDASGKATAIWQGMTTTQVFASSKFQYGEWSKPEQISSNKKGYALLANMGLVRDAVGTTIAIWTQSNADGASIVTSAIQQGNLPLPPTKIKGKQGRDKLLLQKGAFYNKISWQKSPSKHVLSYDIYRDGVYIASVDAKAKLSYADAQISVGPTYLYTVKATNEAGVSFPANVLVSSK